MALAEQTSLYLIPTSEAKAREWVQQLPLTDIGETTKRLYNGLIDLNHRVLPSVTRIKISEILRPAMDLALSNLQHHLTYRTFPLPKKGQRIFDLNQALLLEFAGSYQLAALDMLTRNEISKKGLQIAIYRALDYMGQVLLSSYAVYVRTRDTLWHDIHQLYLVASEQGLDQVAFAAGRASAPSITARYMQMNALALARPYSLRQDEILKIARYLETDAAYMALSQEPPSTAQDYVHAIILNSDEPAVIMPVGDLPRSPTVRVLDLTRLIKELETQMSLNQTGPASIVVKEGLSRNLAQRLIQHYTTVCNRSFNRFPKNEPITMVTRLPEILSVLSRNTAEYGQDSRDDEDLLFGSSSKPRSIGQVIRHETEVNVQYWQVMNSSVSGYGLQWPHGELSGARVGELISLRDPSQERNPWIIGSIKWMEQSRERGLCCGVEVLSSKVMPLTILQVLNRTITQPLPIEGLMLPSIEGVRPDPIFILPAYILQPADEVVVQFSGREERVRLTLLDETLGAFAYFRFETLEASFKSKSNIETESFNSLWDDL
ncbi:hypothetical protein [Thiofilum flexile]|uniref:hypothetical protein n=1 Tax=Thiofilum flexile TaxID=125627 RepID=UPI0003800446|nr:hypothetical protein [Thiofilum flexile]